MADEPCAVLVDVDGTLVDTNYGHTVAWWRAMRRHGIDASMARLHRLVGMGADQLIDEIVGEPRPDLEDAWAEEFAPFRDEARAFPGAADLLRTLSERGAKVVLATSGQEHDVARMREAIDAEAWIDEVVSSQEVDASKPAPDIFQLAMRRVDVEPDRAIVIGDTVWDVRAATAADLRCVAVLSGGLARCELLEAGAAGVYDDVADLTAHLDDSPLADLLTGT